ncbi:hypothetical protein [Streptomyces sp. NPDC101145]|uniref:hypothetical protein n=1 Tax=Streptomyces sp. NPDC101145 TaxID=3366112 RepID=UPI0037FAA64C
MNTTAAALQARVTVATIRTWCRVGAVAAVKTAGRWIIDTASLAHRIAISAWKRPARKETPPVIDLNVSYTADLAPGASEPKTITPQVKDRTARDGKRRITISGLAPLFADRFNAIESYGDRMACLNAFESARIVICDWDDTDWAGDPQARENGRLRTTYRGEVPGISIDDVLDLAAQLRTQLA